MKGRTKVMLVAAPALVAVAVLTASMGGPSSNPDEWKAGDRVTVTGILAYHEWTGSGRMGGIETDDGHKVRFIDTSGDLLPVPGTRITITGEVTGLGIVQVEDARW